MSVMHIKKLHENFKMPVRSTTGSGAYDLYMPVAGHIHKNTSNPVKVPLGFSSEIPHDHVGLILPRSGLGVKNGLELFNTCGVIDSDYRGEWFAFLSCKNNFSLTWEEGDRVLQLLILKLPDVELREIKEISDSSRGSGGFGSTGN